MTRLLRFRDLQANGIVKSWPQLKRLQLLYGFPPGKMLSPNSRVWTEKEIERWIARRPSENIRPLQGAARANARAKARRAADDATTRMEAEH